MQKNVKEQVDYILTLVKANKSLNILKGILMTWQIMERAKLILFYV